MLLKCQIKKGGFLHLFLKRVAFYLAVIVVLVNISGQSEVADFNDAVLAIPRGHQAISTREISVHEMQLLQIATAPRDVLAHGEQILQTQSVRVCRL